MEAVPEWDLTKARNQSQCSTCHMWFCTEVSPTHTCPGPVTGDDYCQYCQGRYANPQSKLEHENTCPARPGESKHLAQCAQCKSWVVNEEGTRSKHISGCHGFNNDSRYESPTCAATFTKRSKHQSHITNGCPCLHPSAVRFFDPITCDRCWEIFTTLPEYRQHRQMQHPPGEQDPYKCQRCGRGFARKYVRDNKHTEVCGVLRQHRNTHCCFKCGQGFSDSYKKNEHEKTCQPFRCQKCHTAFEHVDDRDEHFAACPSEPAPKSSLQNQSTTDKSSPLGEQGSLGSLDTRGQDGLLPMPSQKPLQGTAARLEQALHRHRFLRKPRTAAEDTDSAKNSVPPGSFITQFSLAAAEALTEQEVARLVKSLACPPKSHDKQHLRSYIDERLDRFYEEEHALSNGPRERFGAPSGPPDAELGLLMHCASKEGPVGAFWDEENQSICALQRKGLSPEFLFGFDVHWRAGRSRRFERGCPATSWPPGLLQLHNDLSSEILAQLPFHLLLVCGACPKKLHQQTVGTNGKMLTVKITSSVEVCIVVEARPEETCRITTYIPHPAHILWNLSNNASSCKILDTVVDFYLWLLHKDFRPGVFEEMAAATQGRVPNSAPLALLAQYRVNEKSLCRKLQDGDFEEGFWIWSGQFLGESPAEVLKRGESLVEVINDRFNYARHRGHSKRLKVEPAKYLPKPGAQ